VAVTTPDPTIHRQVVAAARELLATDPSAPISRIATRAGVSRATLYRHFGSREAVLTAVAVEPPVPARERVLAAAAELIGTRGLNGFSMEQLAVAAGVSRATVYRLFPTKSALFGEVVRAYSPFEPMVAMLRTRMDEPPEVVVPALVRTVVDVAAPRIGIMRGVLLDATAGTPDAMGAVQRFVPEAIGLLTTYFTAQMDAGRMRRVHPLLAVQAILGPVIFHLLTREVAGRVIGLALTLDDAADQLSDVMLEGLAAA
jgi:AcrR family transcriptional regulator